MIFFIDQCFPKLVRVPLGVQEEFEGGGCVELKLDGYLVKGKVNATITKLNLWQKRTSNGKVDLFPCLREFKTSSATKIEADTVKCIVHYLES